MLRAACDKLIDRLLGLAGRAARQVADADTRAMQPGRPPKWPLPPAPTVRPAAAPPRLPRILVPPRRG